jgi:hypothetical protein
MEMRYVYCEVQIELLNINKMNLTFQTVKSSVVTTGLLVVTLLAVTLKVCSSFQSHHLIPTGKTNYAHGWKRFNEMCSAKTFTNYILLLTTS